MFYESCNCQSVSFLPQPTIMVRLLKYVSVCLLMLNFLYSIHLLCLRQLKICMSKSEPVTLKLVFSQNAIKDGKDCKLHWKVLLNSCK